MDSDEGQKAKERVRKIYPHSITVNAHPGLVVIKDLASKEAIGFGRTFDEVWIDAAKNLR